MSVKDHQNSPTSVIARRSSTSNPAIVWEARRSPDRGRLEVVAIVPASAESTLVPLLTQAELLELLGESGEDPTWGRA